MFWCRSLEYVEDLYGTDQFRWWLRTGDLGVYLNDSLYVISLIKDLVIIDGRNHYLQDIEATVSNCSGAGADGVCRGICGCYRRYRGL
ncbi:hypothetical protein XW60_14595 [Mycobacteroides abscessus subsp. bolletii]|nr:hypothetical protein BST18_05315 [Mycobacteroides abscessus subsp. bolletii]TPF67653.1 hypothetical protein XW60_14595 [Mycobacteroides abscessus subsp. bolletii]